MGNKTMSEDEMTEYINKIGRSELFDEIKDMKKSNVYQNYPYYLKAIRVSLIALGYDQQWVETTFKNALNKKYLG